MSGSECKAGAREKGNSLARSPDAGLRVAPTRATRFPDKGNALPDKGNGPSRSGSFSPELARAGDRHVPAPAASALADSRHVSTPDIEAVRRRRRWSRQPRSGLDALRHGADDRARPQVTDQAIVDPDNTGPSALLFSSLVEGRTIRHRRGASRAWRRYPTENPEFQRECSRYRSWDFDLGPHYIVGLASLQPLIGRDAVADCGSGDRRPRPGSGGRRKPCGDGPRLPRR